YVKMFLNIKRILLLDNILAALFVWILLVGYFVFPGIFASLRVFELFKSSAAKSNIGELIFYTIQNILFLAVAAVCCAVGLCGISWLYYKRRENYIWLARKLFL
ncbi:hypothetical protein P170DRAFT_362654, partial [Aspergillus steynii IBT 23096]